MKIGFVGQGYVGKNYADDMERRGYDVVRYSLEPEYIHNKEEIKKCDIVFIAVPTPTTPEGFDDRLVREAVGLVREGGIAVIKSTITPGTTEKVQYEHLDVLVLNSPEFLSEASALRDAQNPSQNIIGMPRDTEEYRDAARRVLEILPKAPQEIVCKSVEAELFKYVHNINGYVQIVMFNLFYELGEKMGADWSVVKQAIEGDPLMRATYANPLHKTGRGAGGNCFVKDFAAFKEVYKKRTKDESGVAILSALEEKNIILLKESKKDLNILKGVYGSE